MEAALHDSAAFEARYGSAEAENAVLLERCEALLEACRAYKARTGGARSLLVSHARAQASANPPVHHTSLGGAFGGILGNTLAAALAGDSPREEASPEARLAAALEALGEEEPDAPFWQHGLVAPLAASLGAPLLAPLCATLRQAGSRREAHADRLEAQLVAPLQAFVEETLKGVAVTRAAFERRSREADVARDALVRLGRSKDARARAAAAEVHADAAMARDAARASLLAAVAAAEGARRHAVVASVAGAFASLQAFAAALTADLEACQPALAEAQRFTAEAREQAERRAEANAAAITAFMHKRQAECEAAKAAAVQEEQRFVPNEGRSQDSAVRQRMASSASEAAGAPVFLREGWLMMRAAGECSARQQGAARSLSLRRLAQALLPPRRARRSLL